MAVNIKKAPGTERSVPAGGLPRLESVVRIGAIPIVETGIGIGEKLYYRIKDSNPLVRWSLSTAESSLQRSVNYALPAVNLLEGPIHKLDQILCKSLDIVEERVPSINLPPEIIVSNTRQYVLRRTESVKQIGSAVLDSRVTAITAGALDRALSRADVYVDKYLPPDPSHDSTDANTVDSGEPGEGDSGRVVAAHTIEHGARLRRKLQRRLTRQALAEAKAIREQINVLLYVAELVAKDPTLAWQKARELYASLSGPEPENQARPTTLEELFVLVSREAARRVVHLINYTTKDLPKDVKNGLGMVTSHFATTVETLIKVLDDVMQHAPNNTTVHLESVTKAVWNELQELKAKLEAILKDIKANSSNYVVSGKRIALFLAGNEEREKIAPRSTRVRTADQLQDPNSTLNGVN